MSPRTRIPLLVAVLAIPLLTGCNKEQAQAPAPPPPEVVTTVVQPERVVLTTELPGRTSGYLVAEIRPQVNGLILKRLFDEGADIKAGQELYQIDPAPFQAELDRAMANVDAAQKAAERAKAAVGASQANVVRQRATLTLAKTNRQRMDELLKSNAVSATDRDRAVTDEEVAVASLQAAEAQVESDRAAVAAADAAIRQAEALVQTAKIAIGYTKITAPIAGRIGRSNVTEGATVTAYQPTPMATIQQIDPVYVDVPQSTSELNRLKRSMAAGKLQRGSQDEERVAIVLDDGSKYPHAGVLKFRDVTVDPTTASVTLRIVVPNPDGMLLPGMFVRARIEEGVNDKAILIPQQAVSRDPRGNPQALVVNGENKIEQRQLTTERAVGNKWLVTAGLNPGEQVVVEGVQKVRPGVAVRVAATAPATQAAAKGN